MIERRKNDLTGVAAFEQFFAVLKQLLSFMEELSAGGTNIADSLSGHAGKRKIFVVIENKDYVRNCITSRSTAFSVTYSEGIRNHIKAA